MAERVEVLISEQEVEARIQELADQISKDYEGKELHIICILKGSIFFTCDDFKYGVPNCMHLHHRG